MQAILDAPDPTTRVGIRDRALLHLCYAGGLRVSELIGLRLDDLTLQPRASVFVRGKGRRERCLPLWKTTTTALRAWLAVRGTARVPELFVNARGASFTRLRHRVHPAQTRPDREAAVPLADYETRLPALVETYVRPDRATGDPGFAKSLAVARTRAYANDGNLHTSGSVGEAGSPRIDAAAKIALGPFQGDGHAHRVAQSRTVMRSEIPSTSPIGGVSDDGTPRNNMLGVSHSLPH